MDFTSLMLPSLIVIMYLVGELLKITILKTDNYKKLLPTCCGVIGAVVAVVIYIFLPDYIGASNVIDAAVTGIVSGIAATGANQVVKQLQKFSTTTDTTDTTDSAA